MYYGLCLCIAYVCDGVCTWWYVWCMWYVYDVCVVYVVCVNMVCVCVVYVVCVACLCVWYMCVCGCLCIGQRSIILSFFFVFTDLFIYYVNNTLLACVPAHQKRYKISL